MKVYILVSNYVPKITFLSIALFNFISRSVKEDVAALVSQNK